MCNPPVIKDWSVLSYMMALKVEDRPCSSESRALLTDMRVAFTVEGGSSCC